MEWLVDWTNKHKFWDHDPRVALEFIKKQRQSIRNVVTWICRYSEVHERQDR